MAPVSSKGFLDIQATIECGFTLKAYVARSEHKVNSLRLPKSFLPAINFKKVLTSYKFFVRRFLGYVDIIYDKQLFNEINQYLNHCSILHVWLSLLWWEKLCNCRWPLNYSFSIKMAKDFLLLITWLCEIFLTSLITLFWNFPPFWNFSLMICNFLLLFSHSKNIRISTLITTIITY